MLDDQVRPPLVEPGYLQATLQDALADDPHVVAVHVEAIVPEPKALPAVPAVQQFHLLHHRLGVAGSPAVAPEGPLGAKGAAVGAAPAGQQSGEIDHHLEAVGVHGQQVIGGEGQSLHIHRRRLRSLHHLTVVAEGDTLHRSRVATLLQAADQVDQSVVALPAHDEIHLVVLNEGLLSAEGDVGAAQHGDDGRVHPFGQAHGPHGQGKIGGQGCSAHHVRLRLDDGPF